MSFVIRQRFFYAHLLPVAVQFIVCYCRLKVVGAVSNISAQKSTTEILKTAFVISSIFGVISKLSQPANGIISKTYCVVTSQEPRRWNLEIKGNLIEQVMAFNYLEIKVTPCLRTL